MATVNDLITDALENLLVQADEAEIEASEAKTAVRVLNQMMAAYAAEGINLGYTTVNSLDDPLTVPDGALLGMGYNLSLLLAPKYVKGAVARTLVMAARNGYHTLVKLGRTSIAQQYPGTLPVGSGNEDPGYYDRKFYPGEEDTILSEQNGSISLENDTEDSI